MPTSRTSRTIATTPHRGDRLTVILDEYRQLYALALFRLQALDARMPLVGGSLLAILSAAASLQPPLREVLLVALPPCALWWVRITVNHARSFEDVLRRIESIELRINRLLGSEVIGFQATHPSRGSFIGGRTAAFTIEAVVVATTMLLAGCLWLAKSEPDPTLSLIESACVAIAASVLLHDLHQLRRYRYQPQSQHPRTDAG